MNESALELKNVTKIINGKKIVEDICWKISQDEHWVVLGANGAGKTTLMRIITGYSWPSEGNVAVLGKNFGSYDLRKLRESIGYVDSELQERIPRNDKVMEVVLSGKFGTIGLYKSASKLDKGQARRILSKLQCENLENKNFGNLSQGEKQKIMIARAMMAKPGLLVLDEPALGLDPGARERFLKIVNDIGKMRKGPNLIYITHHVEEIIPLFNKVLVLKEGKILEKGNIGKVLQENVMNETFGTNIDLVKKGERFTIVNNRGPK
ncbi:MAG: ABC transporter ATP-binding protein [Candidatus Hadarchaeota archaeon]